MPRSHNTLRARLLSSLMVTALLTAFTATATADPQPRHLLAVLQAGSAQFEHAAGDGGLAGFGQDVNAPFATQQAQRHLRQLVDGARWYLFSDGSFAFVPPLSGASTGEQMYIIRGQWRQAGGLIQFAGQSDHTVANAYHTRSMIAGVIGRTTQGRIVTRFDYQTVYGSTSDVTVSQSTLSGRCVQVLAPAGQAAWR